MTHPLDGCRLKLEWAHKHLMTFDSEVMAFYGRQPYHIHRETEAEGTQRIFRVHISENLPIYLSAIIGDCVQNIRAALDHLVWELAMKSPGFSGKGDPRERTLFFPVIGEKKDWSSGLGRIVPLCQDMKTVIESIQPFNGNDPPRHPLTMLNDLARVDRHQTLHVVGAVSQGATFSLGRRDQSGAFRVESVSIREFRDEIRGGPFEDQAILAQFTLRSDDPTVDVDCDFAIYVAFGDGGPAARFPVFETLAGIINHTKDDLLPKFDQFFV